MKSMRTMLSVLVRPRFSWVEVSVIVVAMAASLSTFLVYRNVRLQSQLIAATFQNSLPKVRLADEVPIPDSKAYRRQYDFSVDWFTNNIPVWNCSMAEFKGKPDVHYLEIGAFEGRSAVWMLENILTHSTARLTAIDLFDGPYKEKYSANIERTGEAKKVTTIANFSQIALRGLPLDSFDIIYIDGSHAKEDVLEDAVLSWRLLKVGGILIFDDYRWAGFTVKNTSDQPTDFPKTAIDAFATCFGDRLEVIHNSYQIIVRKKAKAST